jgi:hypothetical protein
MGMAPLTAYDGLRPPAYWRARAEEARTRGEAMHDREAAQTMRRIALIYDQKAHTAERREARGKPS